MTRPLRNSQGREHTAENIVSSIRAVDPLGTHVLSAEQAALMVTLLASIASLKASHPVALATDQPVSVA